jgi:large subunit ribosomal protein L4
MLSVPVYDRTGQKLREESIDPADFGGAVNKQLLHDVVLMHRANRRVGTVNTRGRADVAGSGKKLFRQKGTGNARAGAKRTNKRKGGGVAFARRNRDYSYAMPKKAVRTAIRMAILSKFQDNQAIIVEGLVQGGPDAKPQTRAVAQVLKALPRPDVAAEPTPAAETSKAAARSQTLDRRSLLIGIPDQNPAFYRSARNIEGVQVAPVAEFNTYDVLRQRYLVLTPESLAALKERAKQPLGRRRTNSTEPAAPAATES